MVSELEKWRPELCEYPELEANTLEIKSRLILNTLTEANDNFMIQMFETSEDPVSWGLWCHQVSLSSFLQQDWTLPAVPLYQRHEFTFFTSPRPF